MFAKHIWVTGGEFSTVTSLRGHVYKFKSARDKRINIDADEAKTRNTVTGQTHRRSKTFRELF